MLRSVLALLSSLQVGLRIRESIERSVRQAALIGIASLLLIAAVCFGLFAAYQALILSHGFTAPEAAGTIAGALAALGLIVLAVSLASARKPRPLAPGPLAAANESVGLLDQSVGKAMQQVGPVGLLAIAFIAGLLASRRK
jgi:hypothetical protein